MKDIETQKASIALALSHTDAGALKVQVPDLLEIDLWRQGKLDEPRAAEVRSYIFNDPDCYAMLFELETAEQHVEQLESAVGESFVPQSVTQLKGSFWTNLVERIKSKPAWSLGGGFATAAIAVTVFVLVLPAIQPIGFQQDINQGYDYWGEGMRPVSEDWPWKAISRTKGLANWDKVKTAKITDEKDALRYGIRDGLQQLIDKNTVMSGQWGEVFVNFPETRTPCSKNDNGCETLNNAASAVGKWTVLLYWQCQAADVSADFWPQQERIRVNLLAELEKSADSGLKQLLMHKNLENQPATLCNISKNILNSAYTEK